MSNYSVPPPELNKYVEDLRRPMERSIAAHFNHHHAKYMAENALNQRSDKAEYPKMRYFVDSDGQLQNVTVVNVEHESSLTFETYEGPTEAREAAKSQITKKK